MGLHKVGAIVPEHTNTFSTETHRQPTQYFIKGEIQHYLKSHRKDPVHQLSSWGLCTGLNSTQKKNCSLRKRCYYPNYSLLLWERETVLAYGWKQHNPSIQSLIDDSLKNIQCKQTLVHPWINLTRWKSPGNQKRRVFPGRILESDLSLYGNTGVTSTLQGCCRAPRAGCDEVAQSSIPGSVLQTQILVFLNLFLHEYRMNTRVAGTIQHLPQIRSVC